ncbi:MAG: glycoside hydrolase family 9 protein [Oscillospiraceae bacterium]|nr:glycoside hydrolase family 9 protein [Oscillospiraceae bacterium]
MKKRHLRRGLSVITACVILTAAAQTVVPMSASAAANLITNSTFESGTTDWAIYKESGGAATLSTDAGRLAVNISSLGKVNYAVQAYYDIVPLYQNGVYHVHFEISCTHKRFVEFMIQQNGGTYQAYTWQGLELTPETQIVDYEFTMKKETDIMTKLCFNLGIQSEKDPEFNEANTVYLDNMTLELVDDSAVDYSTIGPYQAPIIANQVGYRTNDKKTAVVRKDGQSEFKVVNADTGAVAYTGTLSEGISNSSANETDYIADFSEVKDAGTYYITCGSLDKSYPFVIADNPYEKLAADTVRMFYLQRCGCKIEDADFSHASCHDTMATIYGTSDKIDVTGGWHDAGDYGRYTVAGAKAVADLLYAYQANPSMFSDSIGIPESGNGVPDILDEVKYELDWMLKMQAADGGVYHKVTCETFPGYVMPTAETKPLIVTPVSTTATADFCACMAMAAEFYKDINKDYADKCLAAAKKAWSFLEAHPEFIYKNPSDISTGDYGDKRDSDERYWAACQMYRATGDASYLDKATSLQSGLDWSTVGDYGNIALATMEENDTNKSYRDKAIASIAASAENAKSIVNSSPYGSPITKYNWGSNMTIANAGILLAMNGNQDEANEVMNYLLGKNPLGTCFVTGFGTVSPENPHHRPSMAVGKAQPGMLVGGVNSSLEDSAAKAYCKTAPAAKCYIDNAESYSTNEITIYWNSPLVYLLAVSEAAQNTQIDPPQPQKVVWGDIDDNGEVDIKDAVLFARVIGDDETLAEGEYTDQGKANSDVTHDGTTDANDLNKLMSYLAKFIRLEDLAQKNPAPSEQ